MISVVLYNALTSNDVLVHRAHFSIFFVSSYVLHPHLHSFPTRRSSDLSGYEIYKDDQLIGQVTTGYLSPSTNLALGFALIDINYAKLGTIIDRKSTRLNSSHVRISYAVFCLKKKVLER